LKYESIFTGPLSESKHEAFKVLFPDNAFLDDFAPEVDMLLAKPMAERDKGWCLGGLSMAVGRYPIVEVALSCCNPQFLLVLSFFSFLCVFGLPTLW
jgi:hypothetical protein